MPESQIFAAAEPFAVRRLETKIGLCPRKGRGRRSYTRSERHGHYIRATVPRGPLHDLALDATLRVAAPLQRRRRAAGAPPQFVVRSDDLRVKERRRRLGNLILFVVDASGSMAARRRMEAVKGSILALLLDAYQKRDRVGLITFRGERAEVLLPPTNSVDLAERTLRALPTGGRTPLAHALTLAGQELRKSMRGDDDLVPLLVLVSDGRANVGLTGDARRDAQQAAAALAARQIASLVLDSEQGFVQLGLARELAVWLGGDYLKLEELHADTMRGVIRGVLDTPRLR